MTWKEESAAEVDDGVGRGKVGEIAENLGRRADGLDAVAGDDDGAITEDARGRVHGNDHAVVKD